MTGLMRVLVFIGIGVSAAGCASSDSVIMTGTARPPLAPTEVRVYSHPPPFFDEIALLNASSNSVFSPGGQDTIDKVISGLKAQAAKVGANGIILEGFSDRETGSLGTGVGSSSVSSNSAVGVGVGGSLGIYKKSGHATAIYVPPGQEPPSGGFAIPPPPPAAPPPPPPATDGH